MKIRNSSPNLSNGVVVVAVNPDRPLVRLLANTFITPKWASTPPSTHRTLHMAMGLRLQDGCLNMDLVHQTPRMDIFPTLRRPTDTGSTPTSTSTPTLDSTSRMPAPGICHSRRYIPAPEVGRFSNTNSHPCQLVIIRPLVNNPESPGMEAPKGVAIAGLTINSINLSIPRTRQAELVAVCPRSPLVHLIIR